MTTSPSENGVDGTKGTVLFVDDEPIVTELLVTLVRMETPFEPVAFNAPQEALAYLGHTQVDAIFSDFVMPGMDGLQFLAGAKALQPEVSRVLLTGYADKGSAIRSINEIGLYQYLEKPWDNGNLMLVMRNAVERTQLLRIVQDRRHSLEAMRERIWRTLL